MNTTYKQFNCSKCNNALSYQEDKNYLFKCPKCSRDYEVSDKRLIVRADLFIDDGCYQSSKVVPSTLNGNNYIGLWIIGTLGIVAAFCFIMQFLTDRKKDVANNQSPTYTVSQPGIKDSIENNNNALPTPQSPADSINTSETQSNTLNQRAYELCQVHLVNTFQHTDKIGAFKAEMNDDTLTLSYLENANEQIVIRHLQGGVNNLQFYNNGQLESEKTVYRRNDLEVQPKEIIYSSRTEEITLTITYN